MGEVDPHPDSRGWLRFEANNTEPNESKRRAFVLGTPVCYWVVIGQDNGSTVRWLDDADTKWSSNWDETSLRWLERDL